LAAEAAFAATTTATRKAALFAAQTSAARKSLPKIKYNAGESPDYAKQCGWPVPCPPRSPVRFCRQNALSPITATRFRRKWSTRRIPKDEMLMRLKGEVAKWQAADPCTPVQPALSSDCCRGTGGTRQGWQISYDHAGQNN